MIDRAFGSLLACRRRSFRRAAFRPRTARCVAEQLESRRMLAVTFLSTFENGHLSIDATTDNANGSDIFLGSSQGLATINSEILFAFSGALLVPVDVNQVTSIKIDGTSAADFISFATVTEGTGYTALAGDQPIEVVAAGGDTVFGSNFGDLIRHEGGDNTIDGNDGNDILRIELRGQQPESSAENTFTSSQLQIRGGTNRDGVISFEQMETLEFFADDLGVGAVDFNAEQLTIPVHFVGSPNDDIIKGSLNDDLLLGGGGNDVFLLFPTGNDTLEGGAGNDTYQFRGTISAEQTIREEPGEGDRDTIEYDLKATIVEFNQLDSILGFRSSETDSPHELRFVGIPDIEVISLSEDDDQINDTNLIGLNPRSVFELRGNGGNDQLTTNLPGGTLSGGAGDDVLTINREQADLLGSPTHVIDATGNDRLNFPAAAVEIDLTAPGDRFATLLDHGNAVLATTEANLRNFEEVVASDHDDILIGSGNDEILDGGRGNDLIRGGGGNDILRGDEGNDVLDGGLNDDILVGGPDNDYLFGGSGNDSLAGQGGADIFADAAESGTDAKVDASLEGQNGPPVVKPGDAIFYNYTIQNTGSAEDFIFGAQFTAEMSAHIASSFGKAVGSAFPFGQFANFPDDLPRALVLAPGATVTESFAGTAVIPGMGSNQATVTPKEPDLNGNNDQSILFTQILSPSSFSFQQGFPGLGGFPGGIVPAPGGAVLGANGGGTSSETTATTGTSPSRLGTGNAIANNGNGVFLGNNGVPGGNIIVQYGDPLRVDTNENGIGGFGNATNAVVTPDGRFVAFATQDTIISPVTDLNSDRDVYRKDLLTGALDLVTINAAGTQTSDGTHNDEIAISPNGRFIVFASTANDLFTGHIDNNGTFRDLFIRDVETGNTGLISVSTTDTGTDTEGADGDSFRPVFSPDGRYLAFYSTASDLVSGFSNQNGASPDIYLLDLVTEEIRLVSTPDGTTGGDSFHDFVPPTIGVNDDRLRVVFKTAAENLQSTVTDDEFSRIVMREYPREAGSGNLLAGTTTVETTNAAGTEVRDGSNPTITPDGTLLVFNAGDEDLIDPPQATRFRTDVFVKDLDNGEVEVISVDGGGGEANQTTATAADISDDGRYVVFSSTATDLVPGFVAGAFAERDVFVRDRLRGRTTLITQSPDGSTSGNGDTRKVVISGDGTTVAFETEATNLIDGLFDANDGADVYFSSAHVQPSVFLPDADDTLTLRRNGDFVELFSENAAAVIESHRLDDIIGLIINGTDSANDNLVVDFSSGTFDLEFGITFHGGVGGNDSLDITGESFDSVIYQAAGVDSGFVNLLGTTTESITYTGLEPVTDSTSATDRTFQTVLADLDTAAEIDTTIRLTDGGDPDDGMLAIDAGGLGLFESHLVAAPSSSLTLQTGAGADTIFPLSLDNSFTGELIIDGGRGDDTVDGNGSNIDGEIEFLNVETITPFGFGQVLEDFGDAPTSTQSGLPSSYPTLAADNGASHMIVPGFHLGTSIDDEEDGQPSEFATGDDTDTSDDDDGIVTFGDFPQGAPLTVIEVTITNDAGLANPYIDAWIDFNQNGVWETPSERVASLPVAGGTFQFGFPVPQSALLGDTFARIRLHEATAPGLDPTGAANSGEVEDYQVTIVEQTFPFHNETNRHDVNNDTNVTITDAISVVGVLRSAGVSVVPLPVPLIDGVTAPPFADVDQNNLVTLNDALLVVSFLRDQLDNGEGEAILNENDLIGKRSTKAVDRIFAEADDDDDALLESVALLALLNEMA